MTGRGREVSPPGLAPAIPHRPDRRLRVAGAKAAAVPAAAIKARPGRPVIMRAAFPIMPVARGLDLLGRAITRQEAVAVPMSCDVVPLLLHCRSRCRASESQTKPEDDET